MSKAQEIGQKVQGQTLYAVRNTQDAVVEAVTAWTETANKLPGYARFTKQFPAATEVIDSNFDFAQQIQPARLRRPHRGGHHAEGDQDVRAEGGQEDRARRGKEERSPENGHRSEEIVSGSASGSAE